MSSATPRRSVSRIGLAGQSAAVDENLTGLENVEMVGRLYHLSRGGVAATSHRRLGAVRSGRCRPPTGEDVLRRHAAAPRRGAASLVARPDVLFLDEPTTGLDPRSRIDLWGLIGELVQEGKTILLTTQYLEEADKLADRIAVIDLGTVIAEGTVERAQGSDRRRGARAPHRGYAPRSPRAMETVSGIGTGEPVVERRPGPHAGTGGHRRAGGAAGSGPPTGRREDRRSADVALHRPTLDDVFLSLTGHAAEEARTTSPHPDDGRRGRGARSERHERNDDYREACPPASTRVRFASQCGHDRAAPEPAADLRIPTVLVFELVQPVMFVLLFRFVFAGNIANLNGASPTSCS